MVRQFELYANPFIDSRSFAPLVVVLSSHFIDLDAVVIAPLFSDRIAATAAEVAVDFDGSAYVVSLIDIASAKPERLRRRVGSLIGFQDEIRRGLERLFTGF